MTRFLTVLPLCAALAIFAPVAGFAQTTTDNGAMTVTDGTDANAPAQKTEDLLSLGEDSNQAGTVDANPEVGKPYTREVIEAWEMRCIKAEEGTEPCQMYQLMEDGQGAPVAEISMFRLPSGGKAVAGATIIVPLETALPQQLLLAIDGGKARRYPYAFCNPVGCYVRLGLTADDIASFKRGNEAVLTIVPALAPDQKVELTLSLKGFTASYDKVSILDQ